MEPSSSSSSTTSSSSSSPICFSKTITLAGNNNNKQYVHALQVKKEPISIIHLEETIDDNLLLSEPPCEYMEWFIAKEIADVVLQLSPHYIRRKLNEPPLRDQVKWNTSDSHILRVISSFNPVANAPKKIGLLSKQTTIELVKLMGKRRSLASQFLIAIGEKVLLVIVVWFLFHPFPLPLRSCLLTLFSHYLFSSFFWIKR